MVLEIYKKLKSLFNPKIKINKITLLMKRFEGKYFCTQITFFLVAKMFTNMAP